MDHSPVRDALAALRRTLAGPDYPPFTTRRVPGWLHPLQPYLVPAGLLALIGLGFAAGAYLTENRGLHPVVAALLAVGSVLPAALLVRYPRWAWWVSYAMLFLGALGRNSDRESWPWNPVQIILFLLMLFVLAARAEAAVVAWIGALSLLPVFLFTNQANAYGVAVLIVAVLLVGDQIRRRRQSQRALAEQAELSELEKARRAVLEERTRIARELHDVVAHHMSLIAVRAETAPYRVAELPEPAQAELAAIARAARGALTDMRRLLGVLRSEEQGRQLAPQPGLADLAELVEESRRAGMSVTLRTAALPADVPDAVEVAAYRIVQEALANAARHAPGKEVWVTVASDQTALEVRVDNGITGDPARPAGPPGHGLIGMRERARLLGGSFDAGTDADRFAVTARLPYQQERASS
ncbi:MAG TPA: sensor histidine kinase [Micromonosporaceae bacterium]|nr:sensor histidine kinase [Micromonosporaceae bacterium]